MPRAWTPEQRAAFGERMRLARERASKAKPSNGQPANPISNDSVIQVASPRKRGRPAKAQPVVTQLIPTKPIGNLYSIQTLLRDLEAIPLDAISYSDCGSLLNALSACSTAVALARRQKQEQLEAGSHRAPCKTCGRMIDISKPGGFQILTERDEHFMPRNNFYCSQNCLLARNMPSHARSTPREKKENQA